jgi:hypothetical protein
MERSEAGSGSIQINTDPDPDPGGALKTYGFYGSRSESGTQLRTKRGSIITISKEIRRIQYENMWF